MLFIPTVSYSTPLRAIGTGVSSSIVYSSSANRSTLICTTANWPVPDTGTGALGLKGLMLNPNINQDDSNRATFKVVDNTANTLIISGDMASFAGNPFIGEYTFDNLHVTKQARFYTADDVYVLGSVVINNAYINVHALKIFPGMTNKLSPANGATSRPLTGVVLNWTAASNTTSYNVIFSGTSKDMVLNNSALLSNVANTSYTIPYTLQNGTPYWWKIISRNACGTNMSDPISSFRTKTWWNSCWYAYRRQIIITNSVKANYVSGGVKMS